MILPLYVCRVCGKFGGLGLSFSQTMVKASKGQEYKDGDNRRVYCPDGHGLMYEVQDGDRLAIRLHAIDSRITDDGMGGHLETTD